MPDMATGSTTNIAIQNRYKARNRDAGARVVNANCKEIKTPMAPTTRDISFKKSISDKNT
jgi:hypothetical protein